jgi:hypothetical protein
MTYDPASPSPIWLPAPPEEPSTEYRAFGVETHFGEVINTLTFRLKDGNQFARPYHRLIEFDYNPSNGIRLVYAEGAVVIAGRNLEPLFTLVCEFRVRWIHEADRPTSLLVPDGMVVVESVRRGRI